MTEADFWKRLEFRLCHEFWGQRQRRYQYFWCDGLVPFQYQLSVPLPRITGRCWICNGHLQDEWEFALLLPKPCESRDEIDWQSLLPPQDRTRWMSIDEGRRFLEMEPAVAVPDSRLETT